eukprot:evm.model.scf_2263.1 EVM.evm.TU.scf_2263.1   scf_2263:2905-11907(-)
MAPKATPRRPPADDDKGRGWDLPVQDSLHLVRKAKDQVLFLRQLGDELLEATTSYEDAAAAASVIASARTEADTTLTSLHINFGSLSGVLPSRNQPSTGRGSMRSKQSVKESRGVMERYSAAKRHCGMALEAWRKEAQGRGELGCGGGSLDGALYCPRLVKEGWTRSQTRADNMAAENAVKHVAQVSELQVFLSTSNGAQTSSIASASEVKIICDNVFCAAVALNAAQGISPVRVCIDAFDRAKETDGWSTAHHHVFQKVTDLANAALHYYLVRADTRDGSPDQGLSSDDWRPGVVALEDLLLWLCSLRDMFELKCCVTGTLLAANPATHRLLPPFFRQYKLKRSELLVAASEEGPRLAWHAHVAPY